MIASQTQMYQAVEFQVLYQVEIDPRSVQDQYANLADVQLASIVFKTHMFESDLESGYLVPKNVGSMVEPKRVDSHGSKQVLTITKSQGSLVLDQMVKYVLLNLAWQLREGRHSVSSMDVSLRKQEYGRSGQ
jgi:hypothetical protein